MGSEMCIRDSHTGAVFDDQAELFRVRGPGEEHGGGGGGDGSLRGDEGAVRFKEKNSFVSLARSIPRSIPRRARAVDARARRWMDRSRSIAAPIDVDRDRASDRERRVSTPTRDATARKKIHPTHSSSFDLARASRGVPIDPARLETRSTLATTTMMISRARTSWRPPSSRRARRRRRWSFARRLGW